MRICVLVYHSINILKNVYHLNDHLALSQDLYIFSELGIKILSAVDLVSYLNGSLELNEEFNYIVITFDDGSDLDFIDWQHPTCGFQKSFHKILEESRLPYCATSFVIASESVRKKLVQTCLGGHDLWGDDWWLKGEESGLISIENHSWDHVHPTLEKVIQKDNIKGDFSAIDTFDEADGQINQATKYIESKLPSKNVTLFAYPYGHYNDYLVNEYFPHKQNNIKAAFTCEPKHVTKETNVWKIPRFVCGQDWKSVDELRKIILKDS